MKIPPIKHALENISQACTDKLAQLYPAGIPSPVKERYEAEFNYLSQSEYIDEFELFRLFSNEARKCSTLISCRGTLSGSFIYYLLGQNCYDPLPAYYHCPECGYYEEAPSHTFGIDLSPKKCPHCESQIYPRGYNLPIESVWGIDGKKHISFEYDITDDFLPFAQHVLTSVYPDISIVPWAMFALDDSSPHYPEHRIIGTNMVGYALLPIGNTINDYSDLLSYLDDGTPCLVGGGYELRNHLLKPVYLLSSNKALNNLLYLQRATGIYANEISDIELRDLTWCNLSNTTILSQAESVLFHRFKPKTFKHMAGLIASAHNSFASPEQPSYEMDSSQFYTLIKTEAFQKYPCYAREDFFEFLVDAGVEKNLAFDVSEQIRNGHTHSGKNLRESFYALPIPEDFKEIAGYYLYLFPRAHCVEYLLSYARLAYYSKINNRAFSKIMFHKK